MSHSINADQHQNIIQCSLVEFSNHGFRATSTNQIVSRAGIAKGTLFKYFTSKKDLYIFLIDYCDQAISRHFLKYPVQGDTWQRRLLSYAAIEWLLVEEQPAITSFTASLRAQVDQLNDDAIRTAYQCVIHRQTAAFFSLIGLDSPEVRILRDHLYYFLIGFKGEFFGSLDRSLSPAAMRADFLARLERHIDLFAYMGEINCEDKPSR